MADIVNERRIVVGVDGSESSKMALRWAVQQAERTGAMVDEVHALAFPAEYMVGYGWAPSYTGAEDREKAGEQLLANITAEVVGAHSPVTIRTRTVEGHPAYALMNAAEGADLLVLGSRGHGGFVGALLGSVSQHCVQHATCPVVVIRGPQH
jgi:nucleotide-binding universal stress UspA family protein